MEKDGIICTRAANVKASTLSGTDAVKYGYSKCQTDPIYFDVSEESYNPTIIELKFVRPVKAIDYTMYFHTSVKRGYTVRAYYENKSVFYQSETGGAIVNLKDKVFDTIEIRYWDSNGTFYPFQKGFELSYQIENL